MQALSQATSSYRYRYVHYIRIFHLGVCRPSRGPEVSKLFSEENVISRGSPNTIVIGLAFGKIIVSEINVYIDLKCFTVSVPPFVNIPSLNVRESCS